MPSIYAGYNDGRAEHTFLHNLESLQSVRNLDRTITNRCEKSLVDFHFAVGTLETLFCTGAGSLASFHVIFGRSSL
jgi:hypothetical protein